MNAKNLFLVLCGLVLAGCTQATSGADDGTAVPATAIPTLSGLPNPASVFCEQKGYKLETVTVADGSQSANCLFPDGSKCDEWAFYRGECQPATAQTTPAQAATQPASSAVVPEATVPASPAAPTAAPRRVLHVAYWGAGQITLWTEGAGPRRLAAATNVEQVRLSDDGQVVAYLAADPATGGFGVFAVNADGTGQRLLAGQSYWKNSPPPSPAGNLGFAPASHMLYFTTGQNDLYRVDPAQGAPVAVLPAGQGGFFAFSPDGRWMTLYHPDELVLAQAAGSDTHVAWQFPADYRWTNAGPEIRWKSDSSGFFVVSPSGPVDAFDNMTVWFAPVAGQPVKQLTYTGPYGANLSPDGRTVVYLDGRQDPVLVHVVCPDCKDTLYGGLPGNVVGFLGWAPDSRHFLLDLSPDLRLNLPYLCALGEQPARLVDKDDAAPVVWVDAQRVLFSSHGMSLHLQRVGSPSTTVAAEASFYFDFALVGP